MKNTTFFERILKIIDYHNIKSVNSFAKEYLGYESSEKINRLKDTNKKPSFEILDDISNKFENIDMNWLLTGRGDMLKPVYPEIITRIHTPNKYTEKILESQDILLHDINAAANLKTLFANKHQNILGKITKLGAIRKL